MDQKSDKSKITEGISIKPDKNGGTGDFLDTVSNLNMLKIKPPARTPDSNAAALRDHLRHPSKFEVDQNNAMGSIYAKDNVGDMDGCFSQDLKSLDIARGEDDLRFNESKFQPSNAIVMNHSVLDSKDIAAHFYSENSRDKYISQEDDPESLETERKLSSRKLIKSEPRTAEAARKKSIVAKERTSQRFLNKFKSRVIDQYEDDNSQESEDENKQTPPQKKGQMLYRGFGIPQTNTQGEKIILKPNPRFLNYQNIFQNLIKTTFVPTKAPIVSCELSRDSSRAILVLKNSEYEYFVVMYELETQRITFKEKFGGGPQQYIKLNEVAQNEIGDYFCVCYFDDGKFRIRTFDGQISRTKKAIEEEEFDVNAALGINDHTMPNQGNADPYICCVFLSDERVFVTLFHNKSLTHYHFIYLLKEKKIDGTAYSFHIKDSSIENFPLSCFFNDHTEEIYTFYRQGLAFTINLQDIHNVYFDRITDKDLGQMYLFDERALVVKSSSAILFFKMVHDEHAGRTRWKCYSQVPERGFIYYFPGNDRLNVTTDDKILFYIMDRETLEPRLENISNNYMGCSQLLFGSNKCTMRYCIPFKLNRANFDIIRKNYVHDLMSTIKHENFDQSLAVEMKHQQQFLVTKVDKIVIYDINFEEQYSISLEIQESTTREVNQIIGMQITKNEQYLAVIVGKILILNEQKLEYLYIYKLDGQQSLRFQLQNKVCLTQFQEFSEVTPCFYFKNDKKVKEFDTLIFSRFDQLFEFNYIKKKINPLFKYKKQLLRQPQHFSTNTEQTVFISASSADVIYLSLEEQEETDIDELYDISSLSTVTYDPEDQSFFVLANGYKNQRGFYLLKIPESQPYEAEWLMKQSNNLDIGDACVHIIRDEKRQLRELIVSYKQIYLNTYNVMIIDLGGLNSMIFKHESFLLWELKATGIFLSKSQDFVIFTKQGMSVLALGSIEKRAAKSNTGQDILIHSLESYNFLKHDKANCIMYQCSTKLNKKISIQQEFLSQCGHASRESSFEEIYSVKIGEITLRQALLFVSLYLSKTTQKIIELVCAQPATQIFYTPLLELDGANMVSILSFESRSMQYLLSEQFHEHFSSDKPLFYKNKIQKGQIIQYDEISELQRQGRVCVNRYFYRSAIDNALRNNQVRAIDLIIGYCVIYQNVYISSFLFKKNMHLIFEKGIEIKALLDSKIFNMEFEYEEWPAIHVNNETVRRPYNNSIFKLRTEYEKLFPEECFQPINEDPGTANPSESQDSKALARKRPGSNEGAVNNPLGISILTTDRSKIFKIKYSLNVLPVIGQHAIITDDDSSSINYDKTTFENDGISILEMASESDEINIFLCENLQEFIEFKWNAFAMKFHLVGLFLHLLYMLILVQYIIQVYIHDTGREGVVDSYDDDGQLLAVPQDEYKNSIYIVFLALCIAYPLIYESKSLWQDGAADYFMQPWNYLDILLIGFGVLNVILHAALDPLGLPCKVTTSVVGFLGMGKTFFYLRIFDSLSPIVTMLTNVFADLKVFLLFFMILIFMFAMQISITGLGNKQVPGPMRENFYDPELDYEDPNLVFGEPYEEFKHLNLFAGNFLMVFRASMGDFSMIATSLYLKESDNHLFWMQFFFILVLTNIIFLNFVIAEAGSSYSNVQGKLVQYISMEKAKMIDEAETMIPNMFRKPEWYPKYIVVRKQAH